MLNTFGIVIGATCGIMLISLIATFFTNYDLETKPFLFFRGLMWLMAVLLVFEAFCFGVWFVVQLVVQAIY